MLSSLNIGKNYLFESFGNSRISKFLYSDFYFLSVVLLFVIFWALGYTQGPIFMFIGLACILLLISAILVIQKDILPIIPLLFMAMCVICTSEMPSYMWAISIFAGILTCAVLFHIIFYRNEEYKVGKMFLPLIIFAIAILLGGIGSSFETTKTGKLMALILMAICPLFISLMMINYADREKSTTKHFAKAAIYFGLLIVIELVLYYIIRIDFIRENIYSVPHLGWGVSNTVATFLLITFPFGFYLFVQEEKRVLSYLYLLLGVIEYLAIFLTTSRGALLFGSIEFVFTIIATMFTAKGKRKKEFFIISAILLAFGAVIFGIFSKKLIEGIKIIFADKMEDNGRFELYREAISCFFEHPILGVGFGYSGKVKHLIDTMGIYQFHDTLLQMLACLGIVGMLAYVYYFYVKLEIILEQPTNFSLYLIMAYIGFEGYSLLNTGTIQGFPTVSFIIALTVAQEIETKQKEPAIYRQLINKLKRKSGKQIGENATTEE